MIRGIDHLGIAVRRIEDRLEFWRDTLGIEPERTEEVASEKVRTAFLPVGGVHALTIWYSDRAVLLALAIDTRRFVWI